MSNKILLIEDDAASRKLFSILIKRLGFDYVTAESGLDALLIAEKEDFSLILSDYIMPGISGVETIVIMKGMYKHLRDVPVVLMSATPKAIPSWAPSSLGVIDILEKPVDYHRLFRSFSQVFDTQHVA